MTKNSADSLSENTLQMSLVDTVNRIERMKKEVPERSGINQEVGKQTALP